MAIGIHSASSSLMAYLTALTFQTRSRQVMNSNFLDLTSSRYLDSVSHEPFCTFCSYLAKIGIFSSSGCSQNREFGLKSSENRFLF